MARCNLALLSLALSMVLVPTLAQECAYTRDTCMSTDSCTWCDEKLMCIPAYESCSSVDACVDLTLSDGSAWHDDGGLKYSCAAWYGFKPAKCLKQGNKYAFEGMTANEACCACGGGSANVLNGEEEVSYVVAADGSICEPEYGWVHPQYGDTCEDYKSGGKSHKYICDKVAAPACCTSCLASLLSPTPAPVDDGTCEPIEGWSHPQYKDTCADYEPGGKSEKYACDTKAAKACCTCKPVAKPDGDCADLLLQDGSAWHDSYGPKYNCEYYGNKNGLKCKSEGDKYAFEGKTANDACCLCGGGGDPATIANAPTPPPTPQVPCMDKTVDGQEWHDKYGDNYGCDYYAKNKKCSSEGHKFAWADMTANIACCACGGGSKKGGEDWKPPKPDEGDDITSEWLGGIEFAHKKHLKGGFILYWNIDKAEKMVTMGLLSPVGKQSGWIALGISKDGNMASSDALVGWLNNDGLGEVGDYYFASLSPSGIKKLGRQQIVSSKVFEVEGRLGLTLTRPWNVPIGVDLKPDSDYAQIIYASGTVNDKCMHGFCNHNFNDRFTSQIALVAPDKFTVYDYNKSHKNEPCDGPARVECSTLFNLFCYHDNAWNGDNFAQDFNFYGRCIDAGELEGGEDPTGGEDGVQTVFRDDGGYQNTMNLQGGLVLLWTVNKGTGPDAHLQGTISMAIVSTRHDKQGWVAIGFSPNGAMKGSDAVLGWSSGNTNVFVGDYHLAAQVNERNKVSNKQDLTYTNVIRKNGQIAVAFERPLTPEDAVQIVPGPMHVIVATGPLPDSEMDDGHHWLGYHKFRMSRDVTFIPVPGQGLEQNKQKLHELCAGRLDLQCSKGLTCMLFPEEMLNTFGPSAADFAGGPPLAMGGGRGAIQIPTEFVGSGVCLGEQDMNMIQNQNVELLMEWAKPTQELVDANFQNQQELFMGFTLHWTIDHDSGVMRACLEGKAGPGWYSIGFSKWGGMVGSHAVVGYDDGENLVAKGVYLADKMPWKIESLAGSIFSNMRTVVDDDKDVTLVFFEAPLESSELSIKPGQTNLIFAMGPQPHLSDDFFGYHRFRESKQVELYTESH